jgi:hypothetical protein
MKRSAALVAVAAAMSLPCASGFCGVHPPGIARMGGGRAHASRAVPLRYLRAAAVKVRTGGSGDDDNRDATQQPWPPKASRVKDYSLAQGEVAVRFINSPGRYPSGANCLPQRRDATRARPAVPQVLPSQVRCAARRTAVPF